MRMALLCISTGLKDCAEEGRRLSEADYSFEKGGSGGGRKKTSSTPTDVLARHASSPPLRVPSFGVIDVDEEGAPSPLDFPRLPEFLSPVKAFINVKSPTTEAKIARIVIAFGGKVCDKAAANYWVSEQ